MVEGTLILRGPSTMVSTSEMLQICRLIQSREWLGSVSELAQMRLEV